MMTTTTRIINPRIVCYNCGACRCTACINADIACQSCGGGDTTTAEDYRANPLPE